MGQTLPALRPDLARRALQMVLRLLAYNNGEHWRPLARPVYARVVSARPGAAHLARL